MTIYFELGHYYIEEATLLRYNSLWYIILCELLCREGRERVGYAMYILQSLQKSFPR